MKTVSEQMELARKAQAIVNDYTQEQIDEICLAIGWEVYEDENIAKLAKMAVEETGYGNVQSKIIKHKRKVGGVLHDIKGAKSVGLIERNEETGISKYAKPVGVVCAILPATNPTATCGGKAVGILKGRNAVIFKPSSRALKSTTEAINMMRAGLRKVGAPEDLIQVLEDPSREAITELMKVSDLIVATGSGQVVRAAYSSGTPAYGVGQGNACAIVAEDADVAEAAKMICGSKLFDYATSCSSENAVIPVEAVYDQFMAEMKKNGCYLVTGEDREKLKNHMWKPNAKGKIALNPDIIAKSAPGHRGRRGHQHPRRHGHPPCRRHGTHPRRQVPRREDLPRPHRLQGQGFQGRLPYPRRTDQPRRGAATPAASIPTSTSTSSSSANT